MRRSFEDSPTARPAYPQTVDKEDESNRLVFDSRVAGFGPLLAIMGETNKPRVEHTLLTLNNL
jgi:hypothetical protein